MAGKYEYIHIKKKNCKDYTEIMPYLIKKDGSLNLNEDDYAIGITSDGEPFGAVILQKNGKTLTIRSIRVGADRDETDIPPGIWKVLNDFCKKSEFTRLECRYSDDEPGITEEILRDAGFTDFSEVAGVYRIDATLLGFMLRDGDDAMFMRSQCARLMSEGRAHNLMKIRPETYEYVLGLCPDPTLSFMIVDDTGRPESYVMISELPDGGLYLADIMCMEGHEADLAGLMYMSLGRVFLDIEPDGEFYVAIVKQAYHNLFELLLTPVRDGVEFQKIMLASRSIE